MPADALLGVDIGTSAVKAAAFLENGEVLAMRSAPLRVAYPAPGYAQQDAKEYWSAACAAVRGVVETIGAARIAAVGVDGQSWSCIAVDEMGEALAPNPIWMDTRAGDIAAALDPELEAALFRASGNPFQATYTTPKILWLRREMPEVYNRTRWFLQSNAYIVYRLTGAATMDFTQGYGLHVFDIAKRAIDRDLCAALGIDGEKLPPPAAPHAVVGRVRSAAAREMGLIAGTPVVAGGLDACCGALGAGVHRPGDTHEQSGQSGGMGICTDLPVSDRRLILSCHVVPGTWLLQGGTVAGGGALRWYAAALGGGASYADLCKEAESAPPGSGNLWFLPYLLGERTPIWDKDALGLFFGLTYEKTRAHMTRAVLEGCAYSLLHCLDAAREAGVTVREMTSMGGGASSRLWQQIKADVTGCTMRAAQSDSATALGAAILAGVGVGLYAGFPEAVQRTVRIEGCAQPGAARAEYEKRYPIYLELYEKLKDTMHTAGGIR